MFRNRSQYVRALFVAFAIVLGIGGYNVYKYLELEQLKARAHSGKAEAQLKLGKRFFHGNGVEKDYKKSAKWIQRAAEQGNADAQHRFGRLLARGTGVKQNVKAAVVWLEKASLQSNHRAMTDLSDVFFVGNGVAPNVRAAFSWADRASQYRSTRAFEQLALYYMAGVGVKQDYVKAQMYAMLMNRAKYGEWISNKNRSNPFEHKLWLGLGLITKEQLSQARRMAQNWKPKP